MSTAEQRIQPALEGVDDLRGLPLPRGRSPVHGFLLPLATRVPGVPLALLAVLLAGFRTA